VDEVWVYAFTVGNARKRRRFAELGRCCIPEAVLRSCSIALAASRFAGLDFVLSIVRITNSCL
jgi:hypothetical protein